MNRTLKYSLYFGVAALSTLILVKLLRKKEEEPVIDLPSPSGGVTLNNIPKSINRSAILVFGSKGAEVKELQKILGVTADGIFGKDTQAALAAKTGQTSASLNTVSRIMAEYAAKKALEAKLSGIKSTFPVGKPVTAAATFRAFAYQFRNGDWYPTDANGKSLPSKEFLKTADMGKVFGYGKADPNLIIIELPQTIEGWRYAGVKSTWIK